MGRTATATLTVNIEPPMGRFATATFTVDIERPTGRTATATITVNTSGQLMELGALHVPVVAAHTSRLSTYFQ